TIASASPSAARPAITPQSPSSVKNILFLGTNCRGGPPGPPSVGIVLFKTQAVKFLRRVANAGGPGGAPPPFVPGDTKNQGARVVGCWLLLVGTRHEWVGLPRLMVRRRVRGPRLQSTAPTQTDTPSPPECHLIEDRDPKTHA